MLRPSLSRPLGRALVTLVVLLAASGLPLRAQSPARARGPVHQLRIYEIFEHNKRAFHDRFRDHAMRIMARYDFRILGTWETSLDGRREFVYLLEWPDRAVMEDRWAKFLADEEWIEIKRRTAAEHGQLVGRIESRELGLTDYSPQSSLVPRPHGPIDDAGCSAA